LQEIRKIINLAAHYGDPGKAGSPYSAARAATPEKMNQALNKAVSDITDASNITDIGTDIKVYLLPSLPLTKKNRAPAISGLGILYSEELDQVLQVFETSNLKEAVSKFSREQAGWKQSMQHNAQQRAINCSTRHRNSKPELLNQSY